MLKEIQLLLDFKFFQQYLKDFLVVIKKIQFYKLEFKTSSQQYPMSRERREESDESEPELDDPSSHDIAQRADTWFFKVIVRLDNGGDFSEVLNARQKQLERGLSPVSVISWAACPDSGSENPGAHNMKALCMMVPRIKFEWDR